MRSQSGAFPAIMVAQIERRTAFPHVIANQRRRSIAL